MKTMMKKIAVFLFAVMIMLAVAAPAYAAENTNNDQAAVQTEEMPETEDITTSGKAIAAAIAIGLAAAGGAVAMGLAVAKSTEGISRQPEAEGKIRTTLMLGLVFIETAIIYALLVVILIIFVL